MQIHEDDTRATKPGPAAPAAAGSRRSVAVVVPFITRWFFSTVTAGAVDFLRTRGYDVVLYHLGSADIRDHFFERMPLDSRVEGILTKIDILDYLSSQLR